MKYILIAIFAYYIIKRFGKLISAANRKDDIPNQQPPPQHRVHQDNTDDEGFTDYEEVD